MWWSEHREQFHPSDGDTAVSRSHRRLSQHHLVAVGGLFLVGTVSFGREVWGKDKTKSIFYFNKNGSSSGRSHWDGVGGGEQMCHCVGLFPKHSLETPGRLQDPLVSPRHLRDISRPNRGIQNPPAPHEDSLNAPRLLWDISRLLWISPELPGLPQIPPGHIQILLHDSRGGRGASVSWKEGLEVDGGVEEGS